MQNEIKYAIGSDRRNRIRLDTQFLKVFPRSRVRLTMRVYEHNYADKSFLDMSGGWNEIIKLSMMSNELVDLLMRHIQSSLVSHNIDDAVNALLAHMALLQNKLKETLATRDISEKRCDRREQRHDEILFGGLRGSSFDATVSDLDPDYHQSDSENLFWLRGGTIQNNPHVPTPSTAVLEQFFNNEWKVGERVECLWWGDWVPARVIRVLALRSYAVRLDCGESERIVYANKLRAITSDNITTSINDCALPGLNPSFAQDITTRHALGASNARTVNAAVDDTSARDSDDGREIESLPNFESFPECAYSHGTSDESNTDNSLPYLTRQSPDNWRSQACNLLERPEWKVGDCVEVITFDDPYFSCWLPGQIAHVYLIDVDISAYRVQLDNGTIRDCVVPSMLRAVRPLSHPECNNTDRDDNYSAHLYTHTMPDATTTAPSMYNRDTRAADTIPSNATSPIGSADNASMNDNFSIDHTCPRCFATLVESTPNGSTFGYDDDLLQYRYLPATYTYTSSIDSYARDRDTLQRQLHIGEQVEILLLRSATWAAGKITYVYPDYGTNCYQYDVQLDNGHHVLEVLSHQLRMATADSS